MIHGDSWTEERVARAVRIQVPPGYRLVTALEPVAFGDLVWLPDKGWHPVNPCNYGSQARAIIDCARRGSGVTEFWAVPARPGDYLDVTVIDWPALIVFAEGKAAK